MKKIAIIGSGISGVSAAYYLNKEGYQVSLFEAGHYFGGHTNTIDIEVEGKQVAADTGFLVHNDRTYPNLIKFFDELDIQTHPSDMSFSIHRSCDDITWAAGTELSPLFAQKKNIVRPKFYKFLYEILKFNNRSHRYLSECQNDLSITLGALLDKYEYSYEFREWYLLPMGGCIWSTPTNEMEKFPAYTFIRFCINHGLLQYNDRPQWKTVLGGCRTYVEKALRNIEHKFLNEPVLDVRPFDGGVKLKTTQREESFDYCLFATHPPETREILKPTGLVEEVLKHFHYQKNTAYLHTDKSQLPPLKKAWAAWNYLSERKDDGFSAVSVSYLINKLQPLKTEVPVIVTLNPFSEIDPNQTFKKIHYQHPLFTSDAINAQKEVTLIQGKNNIFYAGAWQRYGFHEDGIDSALKAVRAIIENDKNSDKGISIREVSKHSENISQEAFATM
jgi:predicted NAD/FAD-binding protein